jgi:hypothetical protein
MTFDPTRRTLLTTGAAAAALMMMNWKTTAQSQGDLMMATINTQDGTLSPPDFCSAFRLPVWG